MAIIDDFKARFPEFAESQVDQYLPRLEPIIECYYGGAYEGCGVEITLNLLAHILLSEITAGTKPAKDIQSSAAGSVSKSYSQSSVSLTQREIWLMSSKYGQRFLMLTSKRHGAFFV